MGKKHLIVLAVGVVAVVALFGGILFWAQRTGSELQAKFFTALESGDVKQVQALFHPDLHEEVDEPLLVAWMAAVHKHLGKCEGLSNSKFHTSAKYVGGATLTESKGTVNFEQGTADSTLTFRGELLVGFAVKSDKLPDGWFQGPGDTTLYQERGKKFISHFLNAEPDKAFGMMHENLQKEMPLEKFKRLVSDITAKAGKLESVTYREDRYDATKGQRLKVYYRVECENARTTAQIDFVFIGLKGHLLAFDLTGGDAPAPK